MNDPDVPNVIYGHGVTPDGVAWRVGRFPHRLTARDLSDLVGDPTKDNDEDETR